MVSAHHKSHLDSFIGVLHQIWWQFISVSKKTNKCEPPLWQRKGQRIHSLGNISDITMANKKNSQNWSSRSEDILRKYCIPYHTTLHNETQYFLFVRPLLFGNHPSCPSWDNHNNITMISSRLCFFPPDVWKPQKTLHNYFYRLCDTSHDE